MLDGSDETSDPSQRFSYLWQAEKILSREVPIIPLFYQPIHMMAKKNLPISHSVHHKGGNPLWD